MKKYFNRAKVKSLKMQLISRFFTILIILFLIMGVSQYITMKKYLYAGKQLLLESRFHQIDIGKLQAVATGEDLKENASYFINAAIDSNMTVSIINSDGNVIQSANRTEKVEDHIFIGQHDSTNKNDDRNEIIPIPKLTNAEYIKFMKQKDGKGYKIVKEDDDNLQVLIWHKVGPLESPTGLIQLTTTLKDEQGVLNRQLYIYLLLSVFTLILGWILSVTVLKNTLKPLYNITDTVERINVGQLNTRLSEDNGQLEIDKLACSFNSMLSRIEISFIKEQNIKEKMRQFISDASHELRTPLTSIHGFVEVLLRGAAKNEKQLDLALNSILTESERLTKLVNELLMLTKLEQQVPIEMKVENINKVVEEIYPQLQIIAGQRKVNLKLSEDIMVNINKNQMKQVILNLVQNSVHHSDEKEGIITIATNKVDKFSDTFAILSVEDNGIGIKKEHLNDIFDRFFRSEPHRSRKHGGYGLGLSIVKSIIDAHEAKIEVSSEEGKGTKFNIYLKLV